jgi:hypothetical protein
VKKSLPTKRPGTVEEVSAAVCYLLSPAAAFISGKHFLIDFLIFILFFFFFLLQVKKSLPTKRLGTVEEVSAAMYVLPAVTGGGLYIRGNT